MFSFNAQIKAKVHCCFTSLTTSRRYYALIVLLIGITINGFSQTAPNTEESPLPLIYQTEKWIDFAPPDAGFSISVPKLPVKSQSERQTKIGPLHLTDFEYEGLVDGFMIRYYDLPKEALSVTDSPERADKVFDTMRDNVIVAMNAELVNETTIVFEGHQGREIRLTWPNGLHGFYRIFLADRRVYQVMFIRTDLEGAPAGTDKEYDELIERFFSSFKIRKTSNHENSN